MSKYEVNIDIANEAKKQIKDILATEDRRVLNKVGAFASLYDFTGLPYKNPILVMKTEEPGSKQLIAAQYDRLEGVCFDMINHLINDVIVMGATPLVIQDAIICGKLDKAKITRLVNAMARAAGDQGCALVGGETSEQPGVIPDDVFILTSCLVGVVDRDALIDGSSISVGDVVLSLASSGVHTNGYTLVRRIMKECPAIMEETVDGRTFIDAILEPHRCYYSALKDLFDSGLIKGMAHITGGGIRENLDRILPAGVDAEIDLSSYRIPAIFKLLKDYGDVDDSEMLRTFNLGCGLALVCGPEAAGGLIERFEKLSIGCGVIGRIAPGSGKVTTKGRLRW